MVHGGLMDDAQRFALPGCEGTMGGGDLRGKTADRAELRQGLWLLADSQHQPQQPSLKPSTIIQLNYGQDMARFITINQHKLSSAIIIAKTNHH